MINIGNKVEVIHPHQTYGSYRGWLDKNVKEKELKEKWDFAVSPKKNRQYIVLKKEKHKDYSDHPNILYYIQDEETKKCYIIDEKGIQLAKNKDLKIKVGDIVKLKKDTTLEKLTSNYWCGCQTSTMQLLRILSVDDFNEQLEVVEVKNEYIIIQYQGEKFMARKDIFEIVKEASILDDEEKRYLKAVIRPFKDKIRYISKEIDFGREYYIYIDIDDDSICLPNFKKETMYNGMEENKKYTLKELGLDE